MPAPNAAVPTACSVADSPGLEREATAPPACRTAIRASTSEKRPPGDIRSQCAATKSSMPAARSTRAERERDQRQPALAFDAALR